MSDSLDSVTATIAARIRAGCQAIQIVVGGQSALALDMIKKVEETLNARLKEADKFVTVPWDGKNGMPLVADKLANPVLALEAVLKTTQSFKGSKNALLVFHDLIPHTATSPVLTSYLRKMISEDAFVNSHYRRPLIVLSVRSEMHPDLMPYFHRHELPYPNPAEIRAILDELLDSGPKTKETSNELRNSISTACMGLGITQIKDAVGTAITLKSGACEEVVDLILKEKAVVLKQTVGLEYIAAEDVRTTQIGGYGNLKQWIKRRTAAMQRPEACVLDKPKGIGLYGVPGSAKSQAARVIARELGAALLRLDLGSVRGAFIGQTEQQLDEAIRAASATGKVVLLLDEVDKMIGGSHEAAGDNGVSRRILGKILTWMAEKKDDVFIVMTFNRVEGLPPEFLRKGRIDELFFVDLPAPSERDEILKIHLSKRSLSMSETDIKEAIRLTDKFSGAEIEQTIVEATYAAVASVDLSKDGDKYILPIAQFRQAIEMMKPLTKIDPVGIQKIQQFGIDNFCPAAAGKDIPTTRLARQFQLEMEKS